MSLLSNADSGFPSKRGAITHRAATIAEILGDCGYSTHAVGKWHLAPLAQTSAVGPFDQWPLGRGFERYYGFLEGITDQFHPDLVQDNQRIQNPYGPEDGYHLSEDLVDHAMSFITDQKSVAPDRPYLMYLAFGAAHTPHQAPEEFLQKYRGRYDEGWDVIRERRLRKQIRNGVVPADTELSARNDDVHPWNSLGSADRQVMARMQEAFAAMLDHTDVQIGRLLAHLDALGARENTLIVLMSDNGASQEGGQHGTVNTIAYENGEPVSVAENLAGIDDIGGPRNHSNYPWGWAQAGNTPLRRYKQNTHAGGVRVPLVVNWPRGIAEADRGIRRQFHSVIDVVPTIVEVTGVQPPEVFKGIPQMPIHGVSMAYSFGDRDSPSKRETQYFEMYGHRAIWHNGWKAVSHHQRNRPYDDDRWELYRADHDYSECHDLATEHPDVLHELIGLWWSEAKRYEVFPLDDRNFAERAAKYQSAGLPQPHRHFRFHRGMTMVPGAVAPALYDRSYEIEARVASNRRAEGVLLAQGDVSGGHVLYVASGALHYEYNHHGTRYMVSADLPDGAFCSLAVRFTRKGERRGRVDLLCDGVVVGEGVIGSTARYLIGWQGLTIGEMVGSPVTWAVDPSGGFPYTGELAVVEVRLGDDGPGD